MDPREIAKELGGAVARALGEGIARAIETQSLDEGYARMVEHLSDEALKRRKFPDGHYVPPSGE